MKKSIEQSIFDMIYIQSESLGYSTYDYKPSNEVAYPFVELETSQRIFKPNFTNTLGDIYLNVSIWERAEKRRNLSEMTTNLYERLKAIRTSDGYFYTLNENESSVLMMSDNSTNIDLRRSKMNLCFKILG